MKKVLLVGAFLFTSFAMTAKTGEISKMNLAADFYGISCTDVAADYAERIYEESGGDEDLAGRAYTAALRLCNRVNGIN